MVSKLYMHAVCLLFLVSSTDILAGESWDISTTNPNYAMLGGISALRVSYVGNSKMAAFVGHSGSYKVSRGFGYDQSILQSGDTTLQSCAIGQIINANPYIFSPPLLRRPSKKFAWQGFLHSLYFPFISLGGGAICSAYNLNIKNIDTRKWAAYTAAVLGSVTALYGVYNICFGDSDVACAADITRLNKTLVDQDESDPKRWLLDRSYETGVADILLQQQSDRDAQLLSLPALSVTQAGQPDLNNILIDNQLNIQRALNALPTLSEDRHIEAAQRHYSGVYWYQNLGRIFGGGSAAALALLLAARKS